MSTATEFLFYGIAVPVIISAGLSAAAVVAVFAYVRIVQLLRAVHPIT